MYFPAVEDGGILTIDLSGLQNFQILAKPLSGMSFNFSKIRLSPTSRHPLVVELFVVLEFSGVRNYST